MSQVAGKTGLQIPDRIQSKLKKFQRRIWLVKFAEGLGAAAFGLLVSWLVVFALDRFCDSSRILRLAILLTGSIGLTLWLPWVCHRWIWKSRRLDQVARLLKIKHPRLGDYLLGIIELVNSDSFEGRSESLCRAALAQADRETADKDFSNDVPYPRHRRWALFVSVPLTLAVAVLAIVPAAGSNALQRWLMPWKNIDRYTFTQVESLPHQLVVPQSEETEFDAVLADSSRWNPESGSAWIGEHRVDAKMEDGKYRFALPPLQSPTDVRVRVGDVLENMRMEPKPRPELSTLAASIELPDYLRRTEPVRREIRGGGMSVVLGSAVSIEAQATRPLQSATVDGQSIDVKGDWIRTRSTLLAETRTIEMTWVDRMGLTAKSPLRLKLRNVLDEAPSVVCRQLPQQSVMMEKDVLTFEVDASDDFGIKTIGMEWSGEPSATSEAQAAQGEKVLFAGNPEAVDSSAVAATFSPRRESIAPQTIQLRIFVEDYLPDRERVYSPAYTVFVLSEDEHAIWMTRRLDDWFKQSLETYEREQQLYRRNVEFRNLSAEELDRPETRRKIESQAAAERAQSRRLEALTSAGESLVREAARNDNFGVDHLEKLAEMIQSLKDIHSNRMPSVADLLEDAAEAAASDTEGKTPENPPNSVSDNPTNPGQQNPKSKADDASSRADFKSAPPFQDKPPAISMSESSMDSPDEKDNAAEEPTESKSGSPKFTLPVVTLPDHSGGEQGGACPAEDKMEQAVEAQEDLLAEFQKVAEELQKLIANLEGSTFVKRLKAMARRELVVARDVNQSTLSGFGARQSTLPDATVDRMTLLTKRQQAHGETIQHIEDDLQAYSDRVQQGKFQTVLAEMRQMEIVKQVHGVADRMSVNEPGTAIAHAEFLADTFDRWAEQLVGPG